MESVKVIKDEEYLAAALGILAQARNRVALCTYKFELSQSIAARPLNSLIDNLHSLASNKVDIRVLLNTTGRRSGLTRINENAARSLKAAGIKVRALPDGRCQHAKMLLIDGCLGIIGSHNWSINAMTKNSEISVVFYGAQYLGEIENHFELMWEKARQL